MLLQVKLDGLPTPGGIRAAPETLKRYLLQAFLTSAAEVAQEAASRVHTVSGTLAGSFQIAVKDNGPDFYEVRVAPQAFYAPWVEGGHLIGKRGTAASAKLRRRLGVAATGPRVPEHPFFFPAVDMLRPGFSARFAAAIAAAEKEAEKS
jgi:hypothetical protein